MRGDESDKKPAGKPAKIVPHARKTAEAAALLKAMAHEGRIRILYHLSHGEKTVSELEELLDMRQAAVSQQLARLRADGLVSCRPDGKARHYAISDPRASRLNEVLVEIFCADIPIEDRMG